MLLTQDIFLDLYQLAVTETETTGVDRKRIHDFLHLFMERATHFLDTSSMFSYHDTVNQRYFLRILQELVNESYIFSDKKRLSVLISKARVDYPDAKQDPQFVKFLNEIWLAIDDLSEQEVVRIFRRLQYVLGIDRLVRDFNALKYKVQRCSDTTDLLTQEVMMQDLLGRVKTMTDDINILTSDPTPVLNIAEIDLHNKESIFKSLEVSDRTRSGVVFKTPWQGLNEWFDAGGMSLGDTILFGGLTAGFKSGMLKTMMRGIACYNVPPKLDNLKPIMLFLSLENEANKNLLDWYSQCYFNLKGEAVPTNMPRTEMVDLIHNEFSKYGWNIKVQRVNSEFFHVEDYVKLIEDLKKEGYRVYVTILDYLTLMQTGTKENSPSEISSAIQLMWRRLCNHSKHENILFLTAAQLDTEAGKIAASGCPYPVRKFHVSTHFAKCKTLSQENDFVFFLHIEKNTDGTPFLTIRPVKRRDQTALPIEQEVKAYPFTPHGIKDDVLDETPGYVYDIYSVRKSVPLDNDDMYA